MVLLQKCSNCEKDTDGIKKAIQNLGDPSRVCTTRPTSGPHRKDSHVAPAFPYPFWLKAVLAQTIWITGLLKFRLFPWVPVARVGAKTFKEGLADGTVAIWLKPLAQAVSAQICMGLPVWNTFFWVGLGLFGETGSLVCISFGFPRAC